MFDSVHHSGQQAGVAIPGFSQKLLKNRSTIFMNRIEQTIARLFTLVYTNYKTQRQA